MSEEFPTFHVMSKTGINIDTPEFYFQGYKHFQNFMENRGWVFTARLYNDFELSTTYSVYNKLNPDYCHNEWDTDLGKYQHINLRNLLQELYQQKGFINSIGNATSICDECSYSKDCYAGYEDRKPSLVQPEWSNISFPWIGERYSKYKIAVLGINPNEDGGLDQLCILVDKAKEELSQGKTKVNFGYTYESGPRKGEKYQGTFLWHRIAAYTKAIVSALSCASGDLFTELDLMKIENFMPQKVTDEFDRIVYLNHIKCSPVGDRSKPTNKMWENCGKHVLLEELKILKPEWLLVLGTGDNIWALENHVLIDGMSPSKYVNNVKYYKSNVFGKTTKIITVPHPAAPGKGADTRYYQDIFNTVQIMKSYR